MKIYNVTGYLIIAFYMLACMYSPRRIWDLGLEC
jgi:hypothetical protein